ncbi:MAG: hypothetical protein ACLRFJ_01085 [Alphaproteobacteria bacterium]
MSEYKINEFGEIIREGDFAERQKSDEEVLMAEYSNLEYLVLNNHGHPTTDPEIIARYHELKRQLGLDNQSDVFVEAAKKIKSRAKANSVLTDAIKRFNQNHG